jgi:hypothetical protein
LVAGEQGGVYRVLRSSVALPPLSAAGCAAGDDVVPTAPVQKLDRPLHGGVHFRSEYRAEVSDLLRLEHEDCRFAALLRFTRLPYVSSQLGESDAPRPRYAGDLRYDRSPGLDFSDLILPSGRPQSAGCPRFVPGWRKPRADLFGP